MSKLCPDCTRQLDMSAGGFGVCEPCKLMIIPAEEEEFEEWTVQEWPEAWDSE